LPNPSGHRLKKLLKVNILPLLGMARNTFAKTPQKVGQIIARIDFCQTVTVECH
jgi:hypothetical protein